VGLPLEGQELRIVDADGNQMGPGETGELLIRGENLMQGYYKDPEATAEVLRDGWLHTGDLAYLDDDGYLFLVGRKKELIIRGGANIYPADVEAVIYRHPQVQEAVVVGLPDDVWGECVHACIIPKPDADLKDEEIIALCQEALTDYKVPATVSRHQDLPRTSTNKVKRRILVDELSKKNSQR
jgi:long-chain acyl-CoA synthetase